MGKKGKKGKRNRPTRAEVAGGSAGKRDVAAMEATAASLKAQIEAARREAQAAAAEIKAAREAAAQASRNYDKALRAKEEVSAKVDKAAAAATAAGFTAGTDDGGGGADAAPSYGDSDYWEQRYKEDQGMFDWYADYEELEPVLSGLLPRNKRVLMIGCGNSRLSEQMYRAGYLDITNIDISSSVIAAMKARAQKMELGGLHYEQMDAAAMIYPDESFSCAIDKGTLDAILSAKGASGVDIAYKMFDETQRVLQRGGIFLLITSAGERRYKPLLQNYFAQIDVRQIRTSYADASGGAAALPLPGASDYAWVYIARTAATDAEDAELMRRRLAALGSDTEAAVSDLVDARAAMGAVAAHTKRLQREAEEAEAKKAALGAEVDAAASVLQREADAMQAELDDHRHTSVHLEEYAKSKGKQHGEVVVSRSLEGGDFNWRWSQTNGEVTVWVDVPEGTRARAVHCSIRATSLRLTVDGVSGEFGGTLFSRVTGESIWSIVDRNCVHIDLMKKTPGVSWERVFKDSDIGTVPDASVRDYGAAAKRLRHAREEADLVSPSEPTPVDHAPWHGLSATLEVVGPTSVAPKAKVAVRFAVVAAADASANRTDVDYVAIYAAHETRATEHEDVEFTDGRPSGTVTVTMPRQPGEYKLVYVLKQELRQPVMVPGSATVTVVGPAVQSPRTRRRRPITEAAADAGSPGKAAAAAAAVAAAAGEATGPREPLYVLERYSNISCYRLYLQVPRGMRVMPDCMPRLYCRPGNVVSVAFDALADSGGLVRFETSVTVDQEVEAQRGTATPHGDHLAVRLPFRFPGGAVTEKPHCLVDGHELRGLRRGLRCRFCAAAVTASGAINKALLLPSPYWVELSDFWVCHPDETHLVALETDLSAKPGRALVGEDHVLLHPATVAAGALSVSAHHDRISCSRCGAGLGALGGVAEKMDAGAGAAVKVAASTAAAAGGGAGAGCGASGHTGHGHGHGEGETGPTGPGPSVEYRLFKDRIRSTLPVYADTAVLADAAAGGEEPRESLLRDQLLQYTLATRLATALVGAAEAHGQFRFVITAADAGDAPRMQLTLIGWDTSLQTNHPALAGKDGVAACRRPVLKVRYCSYGRSPSKEDEEFIGAWAAQHAVMGMGLLEEEFLELLGMLETTHRLLPPSCRRVDGSDVGFLFMTDVL